MTALRLARLDGVAGLVQLGFEGGRVPAAGTGDPDALEHGPELRGIPALPAVITIDSGFCRCSQARCTLLVSPPRERPRP
jgi:hypothetical protein